MADYNIYIRAIGGTSPNESTNPFVPWGAEINGGETHTQPWANQGASSGPDMVGIGNTMYLASKGVSAIKKALPIIAAATTVITITDKVLANAMEYSSIVNGDFGAKIERENMRAYFRSMMNPVGTMINEFMANTRVNVENQRRRLQRDLLGDSVINSYTNRGV